MVSRENELWAATRVLDMHRDGRCAHCTRDGCRMRVWAEAIRRQWAAEGNPLPPVGVRPEGEASHPGAPCHR